MFASSKILLHARSGIKEKKWNTIKGKADWCGLGMRYWNSHCSWFNSQFLSKAGLPTVQLANEISLVPNAPVKAFDGKPQG